MDNLFDDAAMGRELWQAEKARRRAERSDRRKIAQADYQREWKWRKAGHEDATVERYNEMLAAQGGKCGICAQNPKKKALAYHSQGLICTACAVHLAWTRRYLGFLDPFLGIEPPD
jgi:hypothetical protein